MTNVTTVIMNQPGLSHAWDNVTQEIIPSIEYVYLGLLTGDVDRNISEVMDYVNTGMLYDEEYVEYSKDILFPVFRKIVHGYSEMVVSPWDDIYLAAFGSVEVLSCNTIAIHCNPTEEEVSNLMRMAT